MGEAIISRGGTSGGSSSGNKHGLITEIFTSNTLWKVPEGIRNNEVSVRIFGGGGGGTGRIGNGGSAGGGGRMNNNILNLFNESEVFILIGKGGYYDKDKGIMSPGTTSFGTYLSALGGDGSGASGTRGFQFGGGGIQLSRSSLAGGSGGKWGGGGGFAGFNGNIVVSRGGCLYENSQNMYEVTGYSGLAGNGGGFINEYTNNLTLPEDGINTIGMGLEFEGAGKKGESIDSRISLPYTSPIQYVCGGGGGYGGNGGNACILINTHYSTVQGGGSGGGGGYGANGGNGSNFGGGGGGGYGGDGGDAYNSYDGGGGGYGKKGKGGYFDPNINDFVPPGIAAGSADMNHDGGSGICIIQYYLD